MECTGPIADIRQRLAAGVEVSSDRLAAAERSCPPVLNPILHEYTFACRSVRSWLEALDAAEAEGEVFFSRVPILSTARAA